MSPATRDGANNERKGEGADRNAVLTRRSLLKVSGVAAAGGVASTSHVSASPPPRQSGYGVSEYGVGEYGGPPGKRPPGKGKNGQ